MFSRNRRFASSSSPSSSSEKKPSVSESSRKKVAAAKAHSYTKKRPALADITNNRNASLSGARSSLAASSKPMVPCVSKTAKTKKEKVISGKPLQALLSTKSSGLGLPKGTCSTRSGQPKAGVQALLNSMIRASRRIGISPSKSISDSVSLHESTSTNDSLESPEFEYMDNDVVSIKSIENRTCSILNISDFPKISGRICSNSTITKVEANEVVDIDINIKDPQFCTSIAHEIYEYLHVSEEIRRPSLDYLENIQNDINSSMRAMLIDWLVEVAEEYMLLPDTLFLAVNYMDRYLSGNAMNKKRLQLLGVACMMIAAKYEEICAPKVEDFCYVTDNTYSKEEVLQMESAVLNFLKFEMTAVRCFLRRFVTVAQRTCEAPLLLLEYLADYLSELSLLEYSMLKYTPSLVAASATFLAKYILLPRKKPWNSTLRHYTGYQSPELRECVVGLHWLCCYGCHNLPAIRDKYSQHKFKFVAKKYCPVSIPPEAIAVKTADKYVALFTHLAMLNLAFVISAPIIGYSSYYRHVWLCSGGPQN